jgi:glycosyltransferase involved in cell wall biosynthesis
MARVDIIIPSYGRPYDLARCLTALLAQSFQDFQILCICRDGDSETHLILADFCDRDTRVREVPICEPGFIAALNAGFARAMAPFVCFTDDDAEAPPHWLQTLMDHFASHPECGAAGGQDKLRLPNKKLSDPPIVKKVGVYSWTGKWHATHHCPIREDFLPVRILKGVNMTYRRELIENFKIGEGLIGGGAQVGTEQGLADRVIRSCKQLHFLRDAWVLHHCAPRKQGDERVNPFLQFALETTYNNAYTLWRYQKIQIAIVAQVRSFIIGSQKIPGVLRLFLQPSKVLLSLKHWGKMLEGIKKGVTDR